MIPLLCLEYDCMKIWQGSNNNGPTEILSLNKAANVWALKRFMQIVGAIKRHPRAMAMTQVINFKW